jgi:hypothetical protein
MAQASDLAAYCLARKFFDVSTAHDQQRIRLLLAMGQLIFGLLRS